MLDWGSASEGEAPRSAGVPGDMGAMRAKRAVLLSLVPNSTIQLVDFETSELDVARVRRRFLEEPPSGADDEPSLHVAAPGDAGLYHPVTGEPCDPAHTYTIGGVEALQPFLGKWLPMPCMRVGQRGEDVLALDEGPSNWTRVHITRHATSNGRAFYRVVLAIDTGIEPDHATASRGYVGPTVEDLRVGASFRFSDDVSDVAWFVSEAWVDDWIKAVFDAAAPGKEPREGCALEHLASYLTLLVVLKEACELPALRFLEPNAVGAYAETVPVDLAIDLGSSRTRALLEERQVVPGRNRPGVSAPTGIVWQLPVRDLSNPWQTATGAMSSRLVFSRASFGNDALSRWSGRTQAFYWPSLVRVGPEAARLAIEPASSDAMTGLSSPMHYVWDERPARHVWRFAGQGGHDGGRLNPVVAGSVLALLTESGDLAESHGAHGATTKPRFSRSSLATFAVAELLMHALGAINEPVARERRGQPAMSRRLDRVVVTPPAAMPEPEVAILRRRVETAVELVWRAMGWSGEAHPLAPPPPTVLMVADTATSTQLAYLENEIAGKLSGRADSFLAIAGRSRPGVAGAHALRIATLDIGGATSGLSVVTYELAPGHALAGTRQLTEGFETGCDAVVEALAARFVLTALEHRLGECRHGDPRRLMRALLGADERGRPAWVGDLGRRLAAELLMPAASALLKLHANCEADAGDAPSELTIATLLASVGADARSVADRLDVVAADEGADGFSPLDVAVPFLMRDIAAVAREVLQPMLDNVVRVLSALDCDIVLLSGGGAQLPVVIDTLIEGMPLRPDRVIAMHAHRMIGGLPGSVVDGAPADAAFLPAIGALLQARGVFGSGGPSIVIRGPDRRGAAGFIGKLGADGRLPEEDVLFALAPGADPVPRSAHRDATVPRQHMLSTAIPALIGFRTPSIETWLARATWVIERDPAIGGRPPKAPLRLGLELTPAERGQPLRLKLVSAVDGDGVRLDPSEVVLLLKTRSFADGYWLDTGHLIAAGTEASL